MATRNTRTRWAFRFERRLRRRNRFRGGEVRKGGEAPLRAKGRGLLHVPVMRVAWRVNATWPREIPAPGGRSASSAGFAGATGSGGGRFGRGAKPPSELKAVDFSMFP